MQKSVYKDYDELPLLLNSETVRKCWVCYRPVLTS